MSFFSLFLLKKNLWKVPCVLDCGFIFIFVVIFYQNLKKRFLNLIIINWNIFFVRMKKIQNLDNININVESSPFCDCLDELEVNYDLIHKVY